MSQPSSGADKELTCRRNANASIQCPIEKGDYTVVQEVALPKEIPQGKSICAAGGASRTPAREARTPICP